MTSAGDERTCRVCQQEKPISEFQSKRSRAVLKTCRACQAPQDPPATAAGGVKRKLSKKSSENKEVEDEIEVQRATKRARIDEVRKTRTEVEEARDFLDNLSDDDDEDDDVD